MKIILNSIEGCKKNLEVKKNTYYVHGWGNLSDRSVNSLWINLLFVQTEAHSHNEILCSIKKGGTPIFCNSMYEDGEYYAKWN